MWDVRVGRFVYNREDDPSTGNVTTTEPVRPRDRRVQRRAATVRRPHADPDHEQGDLNHYQPASSAPITSGGSAGNSKRASTTSRQSFPTGRQVCRQRRTAVSEPSSSDPSIAGGVFVTAAGFVSDAITVGNSLTINAGLRFDHSRAISQDLPVLDSQGHETDQIVRGLGTLYTWNMWSPRLGCHAEADGGRPNDAASELRAVQPGRADRRARPLSSGATPDHDRTFDAATGDYTDDRLDGRSEQEPAARSRRSHTAHG